MPLFWLSFGCRHQSTARDFHHRDNALSGTVFRLAVCVPRPCTIKEAVSALLFNVSSIGFQYGEEFCRLPNDKPWVLADSVAVLFLSMIAILTLLSTSYELFYIFVLKRDANGANIHFRAFSVYTNTQRLISFPQNADTLECLDGIRTITTAWVIFSHVFSSLSFLQNPYEEWAWMLSAGGLWITAAPVTVDTFFVMTGILLVYTTAKKMDGMTLVRRLHLFYLNRMLRMLPLLATAVILDASLFHKIADGPYWTPVATNAERCRIFWWTTLLHLQNYLNPRKMCVPHSWYVALDIQLHILSPVLLFWLLNGRQQTAWSAVVATLAVAMGASAIYNCALELPSHTFSPSRDSQLFDYMTKYYFHVMSRITPFLVGMAFGYLLHLWRRRIVIMNKIVAVCLWALTFLVMGFTLYMLYRVKQLNWNNQAVDTALNILMRPAWAAAVGWMVLACVHGYGGPIDWFLSLPMWRLPGRISYGMYLFHYPIMFVVNGTAVSSPYFSIPNYLFQCLAHMAISFVASFVLTVTIDAPFTIIFRRLLDRGMTQTKWKRVEQLEAHELAPRTNFH
ncbi:unnamed protein product, partial [Iphiclides podalirius]